MNFRRRTMKCKIGVVAALLSVAVLRPDMALSEPNKSKKNHAASEGEKQNDATVTVKIKIEAEGKPSLPPGSKIQWKGLDDRCRSGNDTKISLEPDEPTSVDLPVCEIQIMVLITDFETKKVNVNL